MSLTSLSNSLKQALNRANPNTLPSMFNSIALGDVLRSLPVQLRAAVPSADSYAAAGTVSLVLPDDAKASSIVNAYARVGTGTCGPLTVEPDGTSLSTRQCCVNHDGNIVFYATDAWTSVDVHYIPKIVDVIEVYLAVPSNGVLTIPTTLGTVCNILEAQRTDTATTKLAILAPGTTATTVSVSLNLAKTTAVFYSADTITSVRLKLAMAKSVDLNALLEAASIFQ